MRSGASRAPISSRRPRASNAGRTRACSTRSPAPTRTSTRSWPTRPILSTWCIPSGKWSASRVDYMPREDAARPEFWEKRFREDFTPWDAGGVPASLEQFLKAEARGRRVLIPGCGSGYEVRAFAEAGLETLAIDFAPAAVEGPQRDPGPDGHLVRLEDFFEFDLV